MPKYFANATCISGKLTAIQPVLSFVLISPMLELISVIKAL